MKKLTRNLASALIALALPLSLAACSGDDDPVAVTGVTLDKSEMTLTLGGGDGTLAAAVVPANAANKKLTWTANPSNLVTLAGTDTSATVKPVAAGETVITVKTDDGGFTRTCAVTVFAEVTGVTLSQATMQLAPGGPAGSLTAEVWPSNASQAVEWASDDNGVATVVGDGVTATVTAVAEGTAKITAKSKADGSKSATCTVTVGPAPTSVTVTPVTLSMAPGDTKTLAAAVRPADASQAIVWASEDTSVATVIGNGVTATVTAVAEGTARITATAAGFPSVMGHCDVVVVEEFAIYMGGGFGLYMDGVRSDVLDGNNVNNILIDARGNVHVVGSHYSSASNQFIYPAVYYRNGVSIPLPMIMAGAFESQARAIDIAPNGDAYIVGYEYKGDTIARFWRVTPAGDVETLALADTDPTGWEKSWANAVRWRDGSLYVAGGDQGPAPAYTSHPVIWKDDTKYEMPGNLQELIDMAFADDGSIYVLGSNNTVYSVAPNLSGMTPVAFGSVRYLYSIFVDGNDLYLAGCTGESANVTVARYWKNGGAPIELESPAGAEWAEANDIFVHDGSVYAVGCSYHGSTLGYRAQLWIDGELIQDDRSIDSYFQYYIDRKPACAYAYTVLVAPKRAQ
jgi:uncharacterized protein YjdB